VPQLQNPINRSVSQTSNCEPLEMLSDWVARGDPMGADLQDEDSSKRFLPAPEVLLAAVEASGEAILITSAALDGDGPSIEYANPAFVRMSGYAAHEIVGLTPRLFQGPRTDRSVLDRMRTALVAGEPFQGEAVNYRKDGSTYVVEWLITPLREGDGPVTRWVSAQRDITDRRGYEDRQAMMVRELHHRVRNTLGTVQAVLNATLRSSSTLDEFRQAFSGRIASLAKTHAMITEDVSQVVSFDEMLRNELDGYVEAGPRHIELRGPYVPLPSDLAVPVGMALHELATNAVRHGALSDPSGRLEVTWSVEADPVCPVLHWIWSEHGGQLVQPPTREGFGTKVLNRVLTQQAGAQVSVGYDPDGLRVTVALPMPAAGIS
jgi:PAS domain S-box-containing protein